MRVGAGTCTFSRQASEVSAEKERAPTKEQAKVDSEGKWLGKEEATQRGPPVSQAAARASDFEWQEGRLRVHCGAGKDVVFPDMSG